MSRFSFRFRWRETSGGSACNVCAHCLRHIITRGCTTTAQTLKGEADFMKAGRRTDRRQLFATVMAVGGAALAGGDVNRLGDRCVADAVRPNVDPSGRPKGASQRTVP